MCRCYECSGRRKLQRARWERTAKAKERKMRYRAAVKLRQATSQTPAK